MSSTEDNLFPQDRQDMLEACKRIHAGDLLPEIFSSPSGEQDSYYQEVETLRLFPAPMSEYAIATPGELMATLRGMWAYQGSESMQPLAALVTITAFHRRAKPKKAKAQDIPTFIYNF